MIAITLDNETLTRGLVTIAMGLCSALTIWGVCILIRRDEIKKMQRNGHKRLYFKTPSERGCICPDFMRGMVEFIVILALLFSLLGWLGYSPAQ